ncbi:DUF2891 domain-containing protein [Phytoactinopolyspora mesophila]|uniref:DUF2891 family protein n=1 Tax=Phytoactinopolyspora mesophila TaxID=2650750 RepID=A0A7K3M2I2_9ACTN|nr:DUF2891 domain-containing protein [Phytoactinopolyspora mesophila]NDL57505.1 DUF2891 family protein [Phytoactinopolyspora mesophila]
MTDDPRSEFLHRHAREYAETALRCVIREYPHAPIVIATEPGPYRQHRRQHPAFYGSFDWHSAVEMHWVLARLLRLVPDQVPGDTARNVLDDHLSSASLHAEAEFFASGPGRNRERPYGWGWLLTLAHELNTWPEEGLRWAAAVEPLAGTLVGNILAWLPGQAYPVRHGTHQNSAFGLLRSFDHAQWLAGRGDDQLLTAIDDAARRWYLADTDYPAHYEPSGTDFLSPALAEAELMSRVLPAAEFADWFGRFLPGAAAGELPARFEPVVVPDTTDGHLAHLAGLNLSRAWSMVAVADALEAVPASDPSASVDGMGVSGATPAGDRADSAPAALRDLAARHAEVSLPFVVGGDYMVEHWLAAFALGYLTA